MKFKDQIVGLPVLSIAEVVTLGKVEDVVINPDNGVVEYLVVEPEAWYKEHRLISFRDVAGIGEDAVTTEIKANVVDITSVPAALDLLQKDVQVVGSRVMTRKGKINGSIDEMVIDEETGKITACRWVAGDHQKTGLIPANMVITLGKGMLVVEDNFESALVDEASEIKTDLISDPAVVKNETPTVINDDPLQFFEDQQKQYLIGRTVTTDILTDDGDIIAAKGDKVTQEMVDKAVAADKFVELTLNTRE